MDSKSYTKLTRMQQKISQYKCGIIKACWSDKVVISQQTKHNPTKPADNLSADSQRRNVEKHWFGTAVVGLLTQKIKYCAIHYPWSTKI